MIKCLDDGKGNLDSKLVHCERVISVSQFDSYSNSLAVSLIIYEEIANSMYHSTILYIPFLWKGQQLKCNVIV